MPMPGLSWYLVGGAAVVFAVVMPQVAWAVLAGPFRLARMSEQWRIWAELAREFPGPERRGDTWSRDTRLAAVGHRPQPARLDFATVGDGLVIGFRALFWRRTVRIPWEEIECVSVARWRRGRARLRLGGLADISIPMRDAHDFSRKTRRRIEIPLLDG